MTGSDAGADGLGVAGDPGCGRVDIDESSAPPRARARRRRRLPARHARIADGRLRPGGTLCAVLAGLRGQPGSAPVAVLQAADRRQVV